MRIFCVGLPGVGKTSVAERIAEEKMFEIINIGDLMKQICFNSTIGRSSEEAFINEKRLNVSRYIGGKSVLNCFITGHGIVNLEREGEYLFGSTPKDIIEMKTSHLVVIEAAPETIYQRRLNDFKIRSDRVIESVETIAENQRKQRAYYTGVCKEIGITSFIFDNSFNIKNALSILDSMIKFDQSEPFLIGVGIKI